MRAEDILRRSQPQEGCFGVLLNQVEGNVALARAGGEDHRGPALICQHPLHGLTDLRLMGIQLQCHGVSSFLRNGRSIPLRTEDANPVQYTNSPKRLQNKRDMCIIGNIRKCGILRFPGARHGNGMLLLCAVAEDDNIPIKKQPFLAETSP